LKYFFQHNARSQKNEKNFQKQLDKSDMRYILTSEQVESICSNRERILCQAKFTTAFTFILATVFTLETGPAVAWLDVEIFDADRLKKSNGLRDKGYGAFFILLSLRHNIEKKERKNDHHS